jgi:hypothetical protein
VKVPVNPPMLVNVFTVGSKVIGVAAAGGAVDTRAATAIRAEIRYLGRSDMSFPFKNTLKVKEPPQRITRETTD